MFKVPSAEEAARRAANRATVGEYVFGDPDKDPGEQPIYISFTPSDRLSRLRHPGGRPAARAA